MELVAAVLGAREVGLDVDQIADAIWLSQFMTGHERAPAVAAAPSAAPAARPDIDPPARDAARPSPTGLDAGNTGSGPAPRKVDVERAPPAGGGTLGTARFRSPAASALSHPLQLARALRPLAWRSPRPGSWRLVEDVTADRIARTGLWLAELEPDTDPALDLVIVVDASPRLHVWRRITRELIGVLRSSSAFRDTTTWQIAGDRTELVLRAAGGAVRRGPHALVDAGQRTALLVISDFAGPLWSSAAGLAGLRLWSRHMMLALVSLVPQRSWGRSMLGALPATRLAGSRRGAPSAALHSEAAVLADAVPVPVIGIDPASLATWARVVAGHVHARARGVLVLPEATAHARARYAAAVIGAETGGDAGDLLPELTEAIRATDRVDRPRDARDRVERFCRTHRPEVVELAAALISAPLELSVMLVVQRAVAPHTGTLELAEIIDSGLLEIESPRPGDDEVRFRIADDVRDHLSPKASIGDHLRVLEVVGAYLRDHLGASIDFEALVVHPDRPLGPIADKDRRFAQLFVDELRRLGIDTAALGPPPVPSPSPVVTLEGHRGRVTSCAVTPDGRRVVSTSADCTLKVWDLATGEVVATLAGHAAPVNDCAVTSDGKRVVSVSDDETVRVWDLDTGRALGRLKGHSDRMRSCAVTPDGRRAVSSDGTLQIWDLVAGRVVMTLRLADYCCCCAVTPDGRRLIAALADGTLRVCDLSTGDVLATLEGHRDLVTSCAVTPDGRRAVSGSADRTVKVWDLDTGRALQPPVATGDLIVFSNEADQVVAVDAVATLEGHRDLVTSCAVTPDGRRAVSGSADRTVKVWDLDTGRTLVTLEGHTAPVMGCAVTPDGRRVVSASSDHTLRIWDLARVPAPPEPAVGDGIAAFSDRWVAVAGTGLDALPAQAQLAAEALGRELARRGFGLRTRGWRGVDVAVAAAFADTLRSGDIDPASRLDHVPARGARRPEMVGDVVALILVGGRDATRSLRDVLQSAAIPVVPFRGSGGVADDEAARQQLDARPAIGDAAQAIAEATAVAERLCALIVGPTRAGAFTQLRDGLYLQQPAFARQLQLGLDGRVTIASARGRVGSAAAAEIVRIADGAPAAVLAVAFELLAQLDAWPQVEALAGSPRRESSDAMIAVIAAEQAAASIADAHDRFELWRRVATGTANPFATLNALESAASMGELGVVREALQGLSALLDGDYEPMRERLLRIAESQTNADVAIDLLRRLVDVSLWIRDPFQAVRAALRWVARAPSDPRTIDLLIALARRSAPTDAVRTLLESVDLVAPGQRALLLRAAAEIAETHADAVPRAAREAAIRQLRDLAPEDASAPQPSPIDSLETMAAQYDQLREEKRLDVRTMKLDVLVEQMTRACAGAGVDTAETFWRRGTLGARAVALAFCIAHPVAAPIDLLVKGIDQPRTAREQWTALQALRRVVAERNPLSADPAIAAVVRRLGRVSFGGDRTTLADRVLRRYLARCTLPESLANRLEVVEEWLRAGALAATNRLDVVEDWLRGDGRTGKPCVAFIGGVRSSPWKHGDLAEALGAELTRLGWTVVAAAGREVGTRAIAGAQRAGDTAELAHDGGAVILDRADCVIVMAGEMVTAREYEFALTRKLPILALAFTGGIAASMADSADQGLRDRGVPPELLAPLRTRSVTDEAAGLIARVAGVVQARTRTGRSSTRS